MSKEVLSLREKIIFKLNPSDLQEELAVVRLGWETGYASDDEGRRKQLLETVSEFTIDIKSYLSNWNLLKKGSPLTRADIDREVRANVI